MTSTQIRAIREKLGLTQLEFGAAVCHRAKTRFVNVSQWENGRSIPRYVARMAQLLEMVGRKKIPDEWLK
jgi:DNA-binding transcriptional regulator YiaG